MLELVHIVIIAYLIGANILGFTLLRIQKKEKLRLEMGFSSLNQSLAHTDREETLRRQEDISETVARQGHSSAAQTDSSKSPEPASPSDAAAEAADPRDVEFSEREMRNDRSKKPVKDLLLLLVAALGGALTMYLGMFLMRFKLKNVPFMLLLPAFIGLHIGLVVLVFVRGVLVL